MASKSSLKPITCLSQYFEVVHAIHEKWQKKEGDIFIGPWFRGVKNEHYKLIPSAYRGAKAADETSIMRDFKLKSYPYLRDTYSPPVTDWDYYYLLQHHDAPTRLLDWSEGALIALFFALMDATDEADAAVWMLNPYILNKRVAGLKDEIYAHSDRELKRYLPDGMNERRLPQAPLAFQPPLISPRMMAQRSVFTVHGKLKRGLETYSALTATGLVKLRISTYNRHEILDEQLNVAGITESNIFPEVSGLCRELKRWWQE